MHVNNNCYSFWGLWVTHGEVAVNFTVRYVAQFGLLCKIRWPDEGHLLKNKGFSCLTKICRSPKLSPVSLKFSDTSENFWWWKIVHTKNGFVFFAKQTQFYALQTSSKSERRNLSTKRWCLLADIQPCCQGLSFPHPRWRWKTLEMRLADNPLQQILVQILVWSDCWLK